MKRNIAKLEEELANQRGEIESAKHLFSQLYQVLGAHDANENVLDAVIAATDGKFDFSLLPYFPLNDTDALNDKLAKANERIDYLEKCISVYHSGIVDMFPHPNVTDGTFFVPIEKYNSMVIKLAELGNKQDQASVNKRSSCELECGAYGTYCKCQEEEQLRKEQDSE